MIAFMRRHADAGLHDGDAVVVEDGVEGGSVAAVAVADQVFHGAGVREVYDKFLASCVAQSAVGCAVAPRTRTRRAACSMIARTYSRAPAKVCVSKKPAAMIACAWLRMNAVQIWRCRPGTGWMDIGVL
jgi:hypothetical protein